MTKARNIADLGSNDVIETSATGIDVTGTVTADGLTVDGDIEVSSVNAILRLMETDTTDVNTTLRTSAGNFRIQSTDDAKSSNIQRLTVDHATGDISFYEDTGTTAKFFWDASAERLGIGTSSPSYGLDVQAGTAQSRLYSSTGNAVLRIEAPDAQESKIYFGDFTDGAVGRIEYQHANDALTFTANSSERMRIDSSGRVGIGMSSPIAKLDVGAFIDPEITMDGSASGHLRVNGAGYSFAVANNSIGTYLYNNGSSRAMVFGVNETERMRIDSSGNLLVGKTSVASGLTTAGFDFVNDSYMTATNDNEVVARFSRLTSDGDIVRFHKDGTTVGSIGSVSGDLGIGTGTAGLRFFDQEDSVLPYNATTQASDDNVVSMGRAANRFKDLYLSGGVYLGGTGAANKLDDYEEGTFTPTIVARTTAGTGTYTAQVGRYKKIGSLVHYVIQIQWTAHTGSGTMYVDGLPFATVSGVPGSAYLSSITTAANQILQTLATSSQVNLYSVLPNGGSSAFLNLDTSGILYLSGTYDTSA